MAGAPQDPLTVYVPKTGRPMAAIIDPRSGIVGSPAADYFDGTGPESKVVIDYEGNRYNA